MPAPDGLPVLTPQDGTLHLCIAFTKSEALTAQAYPKDVSHTITMQYVKEVATKQSKNDGLMLGTQKPVVSNKHNGMLLLLWFAAHRISSKSSCVQLMTLIAELHLEHSERQHVHDRLLK